MSLKYKKNSWMIFLVTIIILLCLMGFISQYFFQSREKTDVLVFYHWWTSSGEQAAINSLISAFSNKHPNTIILPTPIISKSSAGGGFVLFSLVEPLVFVKKAPDAFQIHAGYEGKPFFDANLLQNVNDIWEKENLTKVTPRVIQAMCKFQGDYYSVPINIHRTNVVWYNKEILDKNNIDPLTLTDWDKFFEACDKIRESGIQYPIQMGTTWTAQHTFDQIIASIGIEFYEDWINGKVVYSEDERLIQAFEIFKKYLSYVNPDNAEISWDTATKRIISKEGAFNIMGDWANGEFKAEEQKYNEDYGTFAVPGTGRMYGIVVDTFEMPKYVEHPENAKKWLSFVASKEGQDTFNPKKGSISARIDTDASKYDLYQRLAILDFLSIQYFFPAISNGMTKAFEEKEQQVVEEFVKDLDVAKATKEITDYTRKTASDYSIVWYLK